MLSRIAMCLFGLLFAGQAFAVENLPKLSASCQKSISQGREAWFLGAYNAPPDADSLMIDAIDGKLAQLRAQLKRMPPPDATRWRQSAMVTAAYAGQSAVVDALLDDGASVNGSGWIPALKPGVFKQVVKDMKHEAGSDNPASVTDMEDTGLLKNQGQEIGPALVIAAACNDAATVNVLLQHHADVMARVAPNVVDALDAATTQGNAIIVKALLDHGADPCMFALRSSQHAKTTHRPVTTLEQIGCKVGLPGDLTVRLSCPAITPAG
jgi:hypothetical protein